MTMFCVHESFWVNVDMYACVGSYCYRTKITGSMGYPVVNIISV